MAKQRTVLTIFLSSPSNLGAERLVIEKVVQALNEELRPAKQLEFEVLHWQMSAVPGVGLEPQAVISSQTSYDIYIGMLGTTFGSPTKSSNSGTEHEFKEALATYARSPESVRVLFYFSTKADDIFDIDLVQLAKVKEFRSTLSGLGVLYGSFESLDALQELIRAHLRKLVFEQWVESKWCILTPVSGALKTESSRVVGGAKKFDVLEADEDRPGLLELSLLGVQASKSMTAHLARMTSLASNLTKAMELATLDGDVATKNGESESAIAAVDGLAAVMQEFAGQAKAEVPIYEAAVSDQIMVVEELGSLLFDENTGDRETFVQVLTSFSTFVEAARGVRSQLTTFRGTVQKFPVMTKAFRLGKKAVLDSFDELLASYTVFLSRADMLVSRLHQKLDEQTGDFAGTVQ